jgi:AcrR family transcriptional regulator
VSAKATRRELNARQAETVERVALAAREELREVGFDGLTVRSVAGRAAVAPATAYTYFSSKNHLIAEIFWRRLVERPHLEQSSDTPVEAVIAVFTDLVEFIKDEPELAAAVTSALLGSDPDVRELRTLIGSEINDRLTTALGPSGDPEVLAVLNIIWSGALLQVGMGHARVERMGERLATATRMVLGA